MAIKGSILLQRYHSTEFTSSLQIHQQSPNTKMTSNKMIIFAFFALVVVSVLGHGHQKEHHGPANYKFEYGVHDPHTGDKKQQYEVRNGHVVKGAYSLADADGTLRVVEYTADPHSGFNAVVKKIGHAHHPQHYHHSGGANHGHGGAHSHVGVTHFGYQH